MQSSSPLLQGPTLWPRSTRNRRETEERREAGVGGGGREAGGRRDWLAWTKNRKDSDSVDAWLRIWEEFSPDSAALLLLLIVFCSMDRERKARLRPSIHYWWLAISFLCNICSHRQTELIQQRKMSIVHDAFNTESDTRADIYIWISAPSSLVYWNCHKNFKVSF